MRERRIEHVQHKYRKVTGKLLTFGLICISLSKNTAIWIGGNILFSVLIHVREATWVSEHGQYWESKLEIRYSAFSLIVNHRVILCLLFLSYLVSVFLTWNLRKMYLFLLLQILRICTAVEIQQWFCSPKYKVFQKICFSASKHTYGTEAFSFLFLQQFIFKNYKQNIVNLNQSKLYRKKNYFKYYKNVGNFSHFTSQLQLQMFPKNQFPQKSFEGQGQ